ncbi:transcription intermediary factor 1-alpha-like isoform X2 [Lineus longissimus]|uniref:transcription intermediary factor 1-alpha-like isoform X2 n=1 Tax=Lineus longissimus TaxID=88925 RepID=UPI00315CC5C2
MEATTTESSNPPMAESCGICKENFEGKDPQLLPCLHSFCKPCLNNVSVDSTEENKPACPTCKQVYTAQDVIENRFIIELLNSRVTQPEENKDNICTGCDDNIVASSYCSDCMEWLCVACVQAHRRVRVTKDHTIVPKESAGAEGTSGANAMEKTFPRCPVHPKELLKLYCDTCEQLTCRDCQLENHKDHKYDFIDNHSEKYKEWMKDVLKRIAEKRAYIENAKVLINRRFNDIKEKEQEVGNKIKMFAIQFITDINRRGKELLSDLNAVCSAKKNQLEQKHKEILNLSNKLDHSMLFTEQALNSASSQALLYTKKTMSSQLLHVLRTRCEVPNPNHHIDIKFSFDKDILKNQIPNVGKLQVDGFAYNGPHSQQLARKMQLGSPTTLSFNSLSPEQKNAMLLRMTSQNRQALLASVSPVGSPSGSTQPRFQPSMSSGGNPIVHSRPFGKGNNQSRSLNPRPILPKPQGLVDVSPTAAAGSSQGQISSTSTSMNCTVPASTMSMAVVNVIERSGTSPSSTSSTGADNTRPSSSDSVHASDGIPIKTEVDLNPKTFSFDTDPASLANMSIKREVHNEAETLNMSGSPPQSPGSTNQNEAYNLNEPITDQAMGFQQQPTCMPESNDPNEDYCACCHNGGDLLCCDNCPNVFHLKCHVPELSTAPTGDWSCGLCVKEEELILKEPEVKHDHQSGDRKRKMNVGLTEREIKVCERILLQLFCHPTSPPFHEPVSKAIPNYHKIITNPMDFTTVRCKISPKHFNHYSCLDDFVSDVRLVFINCAKYNTDYSEVGKAGRDLEKFFEGLLKQFAPWYEYTFSHQIRDTSTPNSDKSDCSRGPTKKKRKPDEIVHVN